MSVKHSIPGLHANLMYLHVLYLYFCVLTVSAIMTGAELPPRISPVSSPL